LEVRNLEEGDTCSYKVKSSCNAPGFRVRDANAMSDDNVEVSFIEYEKRYLSNSSTDSYGSGETKNGRKSKQPSDDKPPRNSSYGRMNRSRSANCTTEWSVTGTGTNGTINRTEWRVRYPRTAINFTLETNGTYTVTVCSRGQRKPRRRHRNGTETNNTDMEDAKRERRRRRNNSSNGTGGGSPSGSGNSTGGNSSGPGGSRGRGGRNGRGGRGRERTEGPAGNRTRGNRTETQRTNSEWGQAWEGQDTEGYDDEGTKADVGYGRPSKGNYSASMGGYKAFGTEGQGDSRVGLKEDYSETCSDRVLLITVTATDNTTSTASSSSSSSLAHGHPVVMSSESYMIIEVGNYEFLSDIDYTAEEEEQGNPNEESALVLKAPLMVVSLVSLVVMNLLA